MKNQQMFERYAERLLGHHWDVCTETILDILDLYVRQKSSIVLENYEVPIDFWRRQLELVKMLKEKEEKFYNIPF